MTEPLYVYPWSAWPAWSQLFRAAKGALSVDTLLAPQEAVPGCGKCVALGEPPPFAVEYAYLPNPLKASVQSALSVYLGLTKDPRWTSMESSLNRLFGVTGIREVF